MENPLLSSSIDPSSLDLLFDKDPELLSSEEIDLIIATLRANRAKWAAEEESAAIQGRRTRRSEGTAKTPKKKMTLDDLGDLTV